MNTPHLSPFGKPLAALPVDRRIEFYERLAHELTIAVRGIWSDTTLSDAEKVDRMKWINEIMHRIPNKLVQLRTASHDWPEEDFEAMMADHVSRNPQLRNAANRAINAAFRLATGQF